MIRRSVRSVTAATVFAVLLISIAPAMAAGFWECRAGVWVGVDAPHHAEPLRACGDKPSLPRSEGACRAVGGRWARAGLFPKPICTVPTRDGGRACGDGQECEGTCLYDTRGDRAAQFGPKPQGPATGICTRARPVFGCMVEVTRGRIGRRICRD